MKLKTQNAISFRHPNKPAPSTLPDRQIWQVPPVATRLKKAKPWHKAFGRAVKSAREEKGLTQAEFVQKPGLHVSYLSGVENGQPNPSLTALSQIAQALGLRLSKLISRAGPSTSRGDGRGCSRKR